jgi:hypothetical protein
MTGAPHLRLIPAPPPRPRDFWKRQVDQVEVWSEKGTVILSSHKPGSPIEAIARDAAVTVSIALQFGAPLETIRAALTKDHDGGPATLLGAALDALVDAAR